MYSSTFDVSSLQHIYIVFCCFEYSYISKFFHDSKNVMPLMQENYVSVCIGMEDSD